VERLGQKPLTVGKFRWKMSMVKPGYTTEKCALRGEIIKVAVVAGGRYRSKHGLLPQEVTGKRIQGGEQDGRGGGETVASDSRLSCR